ncbi:MAG: GNAT family N-acetyltransferase [Candidatus Freyarchaeota archaeon]
MELKQFDLDTIEPLREAWLKELKLPLITDFFDLAVKNGTCWGLCLKNEIIAYWIYLEKFPVPWYGKSVIEFYVKKGYRGIIDEIFNLLIKQFAPKRFYVRSDDTYLFSFLLEKGYPFELAGSILLREKSMHLEQKEKLTFTKIPKDMLEDALQILLSEELEVETAQTEDYQHIESEIGGDTYWILIRENIVVGVAYWKKSRYPNYVTVIPIIHKSFRRRGYGSYMISKLADYLDSRGYQPVSFTTHTNISARRAFGKAGFHAVALQLLFNI